jgi:hypothetical protein
MRKRTKQKAKKSAGFFFFFFAFPSIENLLFWFHSWQACHQQQQQHEALKHTHKEEQQSHVLKNHIKCPHRDALGPWVLRQSST